MSNAQRIPGPAALLPEPGTHAHTLQVLREFVDAVHSQEPATIARGMRAAAAVLAQVEGDTCATE